MTTAPVDRPLEALNRRKKIAEMSVDPTMMVTHLDNDEEETYNSKIANFSKGLQHDPNTGEVVLDDYDTFLKAVKDSLANTPDYQNAIANFETVPVGTSISGPKRKFVNPVCGLSYDSEGLDGFNRIIPYHPKLNSLDAAAEMAELYWMALMRDTNFTDYDESHTMAKDAIADLNNNFSTYPHWTLEKTPITAKTLFRGLSLGNAYGPYISQFLYRGNKNVTLDLKEEKGLVAYGTQHIDQRCLVAKEGLDFMTDFPNWLKVQDGANTGINRFDDRFIDVANNPEQLSDQNNTFFDKNTRFIKNLRDLATYVHFDALYQAYFVACSYMLSAGFPFSDGLPYKPDIESQEGFGNYGGPHILSLLTEVATRALKAVWFQKWYVYRRVRPEAFGWLIHRTKTDGIYDIHSSLINDSTVLAKVFEHNKKLNDRFQDRKNGGTYLLPQAFREGSPLHPSYGAGHATVAGACITILKAWFKDLKPIPGTIWESNHDGSELKEYKGNDKNEISVHGELNKLASNIAIGRNAGGVHYRTDYTASLTLGEEVAISILKELIMYLPEKSTKFHFKRFFTKKNDPELEIP
jgi:hypothetical protein